MSGIWKRSSSQGDCTPEAVTVVRGGKKGRELISGHVMSEVSFAWYAGPTQSSFLFPPLLLPPIGHAGHGHATAAGGLAASSIPLPLFKIFLQLLLTGLNVCCWLVPMKIKRFRENQSLISLANAFSGGVFLSLAFGHMIPHSLGGFEAGVSQ